MRRVSGRAGCVSTLDLTPLRTRRGWKYATPNDWIESCLKDKNVPQQEGEEGDDGRAARRRAASPTNHPPPAPPPPPPLPPRLSSKPATICTSAGRYTAHQMKKKWKEKTRMSHRAAAGKCNFNLHHLHMVSRRDVRMRMRICVALFFFLLPVLQQPRSHSCRRGEERRGQKHQKHPPPPLTALRVFRVCTELRFLSRC